MPNTTPDVGNRTAKKQTKTLNLMELIKYIVYKICTSINNNEKIKQEWDIGNIGWGGLSQS